MELHRSKNRVTLSGRSDAGEQSIPVRSPGLPRDKTPHILRMLVDAATRQETLLGCDSTPRY